MFIYLKNDTINHLETNIPDMPQEPVTTEEVEVWSEEPEEEVQQSFQKVEKKTQHLKQANNTQSADTMKVPKMDFQNRRMNDFIEFNSEHNVQTHGVNFKEMLTDKPVYLPGIAGDPLPYRLRNDVYITSTLLVSLFFALFIVSRSWHVFQLQIKDFFYNKNRNETVMLSRESEMKTQTYINLLSCFLLSIVFFNYSEYALPEVFNRVSPYKLLLLDIGILAIFYISKMIFYSITNWTFFSQQSIIQWDNIYNLISLIKVLMYFPLAFIVVYFDISAVLSLWITGFIIICFEMMAIFKAKQIFFNYNLGQIHLFMYFCTLEFAPIILLWATLIFSNELTIVYI